MCIIGLRSRILLTRACRYTVLVRRYQNQGITLPQPAGTPEPGACSATDDDDIPYSSSMYEDLLLCRTQVSTPETRSSWPMEEPYSEWSTHDTFPMTSTASDFNHTLNPMGKSLGEESQWAWSSTSMSNPSMMQMASPNGYTNVSDPSMFATYDGYGNVSPMLSPHPTHYLGSNIRVPMGSPTSPSYQDPQAMARFMRYGTQTHPPYYY